jgi:hypothetical protein
MPKHARTVTIKACPICGGRHTYHLRLGTTYLFAGKSRKEKGDGMRHLTIVLECPIKSVSFKAEVAIPMKTYLWISEVDARPA